MGIILLGYGVLRNIVLKHKKEFGFLAILSFVGFLCYSYTNEGRAGKVYSLNVDYDGPDLMDSFSFVRNYNEKNLENMRIGDAVPNPLDAEKAVEKLIKLEQETLSKAEAAVNGSILDTKPVYDEDGHEIGLRFLIISNWGGIPTAPYKTDAQIKVSQGMAELAERYDSSFVLSLGDNFRDKGVSSINDSRFKDTFENVFTPASLQHPWYVIAGDVDYRGNVSAQIEYSKRSSRWKFNRKYYKISSQLATFKNVTVDIVMIDTVELCGGLPPSGIMQPLGPHNVTAAEEQWSWLNEALKISAAEYLIVAGHYPVFSGGIHGSTKCLVDRLQPILKEYHVSAYFGGHDHSVQHIKSASQGGVHYFVNGAANDQDDRPDHLDGILQSTKYFWTNHLDKTTGAFTYCDVRKDQMSVTFVHSDQTVLYTTVIFPRSHPCNKIPDEDIVIKTVKAPAVKMRPPKPKKKAAADRLPVFQKFRPKTKTELQKDDLRRHQQQQRQIQQQYKKRQQRLLEQQQLQAQRNANQMIYRYRGP